MSNDQMELFETTPAKVRKRTVPSSAAPTWKKYNQRDAKRPHQCDFCVLNCHADPSAPIPRKARYVRVTSEQQWYLCLAHANDQRIVDGLGVYRGSP